MGEVFDRYTDTVGNYHYSDTETWHHVIPKAIEAWNRRVNDDTWRIDVGNPSLGDSSYRTAKVSQRNTGGRVMEELKPCPFCGGTAVSVQNVTPRLYRPIRNHQYSVVCWECDIWFGYDEDYGGRFDTETEAVKAWNRRTSDDT